MVIGDLILDNYIFGLVDRISPEAPVPVVWANREEFVCGGAANVGVNLVDLGARVDLCGVIGKDYFGDVLFSHVKKRGIESRMIVRDPKRPTTLKTRILASHQQILRLDWESLEFLELDINKKIFNKVKKHIDDADAVIIEDYGKGVINPGLVKDLVELCRAKGKVVTVDPKEEHLDYYTDVTALTPNLKEAQVAANMKIRSKDEIPLLGEIIMDRLKPKGLLLTLGEHGMMVFHDNKVKHIPSHAREVYDVTGAGDTVISVFTMALSCGASFFDAAAVANYAASIVVGKLGAQTTTRDELIKRIEAK